MQLWLPIIDVLAWYACACAVQVLGYDSPEDYLTAQPCTYFGVVVGRVANRIANAKWGRQLCIMLTPPCLTCHTPSCCRFSVDGQSYSLLANNGPNALHGALHSAYPGGSQYSADGFCPP